MTQHPLLKKDKVKAAIIDDDGYIQDKSDKSLIIKKELIQSLGFFVLTMFPLITIWFLRIGASQDEIFFLPDISSIAVIILAQAILKYHYKKIAIDYIVSADSPEQEFINEKITIKSIGLLFWFGVTLIIFSIMYYINLHIFKKLEGLKLSISYYVKTSIHHLDYSTC